MSEWQPIETAPKEGPFLGYWPEEGCYVLVTWWLEGWMMKSQWWGAVGQRRPKGNPTHWIPLPEPPQGTK